MPNRKMLESCARYYDELVSFDAPHRLPGNSLSGDFLQPKPLEKTARSINEFPDVSLVGLGLGLAATIEDMAQDFALSIDDF